MSTTNSDTPDQEPSATVACSFDDSDTRADELCDQLGSFLNNAGIIGSRESLGEMPTDVIEDTLASGCACS